MTKSSRRGLVIAALTATLSISPAKADVTAQDLARISHVLVIYAENRSFDHLYGNFPGAAGLADATGAQKTQLDHDGTPLPYLTTWQGDKPHPRFGARMPNGPFLITAPPIDGVQTEILPSPIHAFYHNAEQINGGANNMFVAMSNAGGWAMGYFDTSKLRLWKWASEFTLADNLFMGAYGGSFLNHQYLICACAPVFKDAPAASTAVLDPDGRMKKREGSPSAKDGPVKIASNTQVTPDGFAVNTTQPPYQPSGISPAPGGDPRFPDPKGTELSGLPLPPQTIRTIGDTLSGKGVDWAWYAGAWNLAQEDGPRAAADRKVIYKGDGAPNFQAHHQPFNYHARFAPGTADRARYLRDGEALMTAIEDGTLPSVAFYKPPGIFNQHPMYTDLVRGDAHIAGVLDKLRANPTLWASTLVIVTYDENGGFWDHAAPPSGPGWSDRWGPGTRVPALIISPFARKGHVDHTRYDTGSIIRFITRRFGLDPLPGVRANVGDLTEALRFE